MLPFGDLGPATVIWDVDGVALDLGPTLGGVVFTDEAKYAGIKEDGYGDTEVDGVFTGRACSLVVPMTRSQLTQLEKVIPSASVLGTVMTVKASVGTQMEPLAKKVTVKRLIDNVASTDPDEWLTLFKAYPFAKSDWKFDNTNQRICEVTFLVFPMTTSGHIGEMWAVGE
jgi:hypothetical protein